MSNSYQRPVVPDTRAVASGVAPAAGRVFQLRDDSAHDPFETGYRPTVIAATFLSSMRPKRRSLAEVIASVDPTPVRSNRRYVSRLKPGAFTRFTSIVV